MSGKKRVRKTKIPGRGFSRQPYIGMAELLLVNIIMISSCHSFYMHRTYLEDFACAPGIYEDVPVVVQDVVSEEDRQLWMRHILTRSKRELVRFQRNHQPERSVALQDAAEQILISSSGQSSHADPMYATSYGSSCSTDQLPLTDTVEDLFVNEFTETDDTFNWFSCLAPHASVYDTLVLAGEGASSSPIQSHPFTKMSLCLKGSQLWRLIPPSNKVLQASASPIMTTAWEGFEFSTGLQAPLDWNLFQYRHRDVDREIMDINQFDSDDDDEDEYSKHEAFQMWAEDPTSLLPNFNLPRSIEGNDDRNFVADDDGNHFWHSTVTVAGDLLVIPPGWWYQSYNLGESSVSVLSQRCTGNAECRKFIGHITENSRPYMGGKFWGFMLKELQGDAFFTPEEAQETIDFLFELLGDNYRRDSSDRDVDSLDKQFE